MITGPGVHRQRPLSSWPAAAGCASRSRRNSMASSGSASRRVRRLATSSASWAIRRTRRVVPRCGADGDAGVGTRFGAKFVDSSCR